MRVFISYRRADLRAYAHILVGRLADHLRRHFGDDNIFLDTITIPAGREFVEVINENIAQAQVILAIIGPQWLKELQQRKNDKVDFVVEEIKSALNRKIPVLPVLVDDTSMPGDDVLPESLHQLNGIHAFSLDSGKNFLDRVAQLIVDLENLRIPTFIEQGEFRAIKESFDEGSTLKFLIQKKGLDLSYGEVLDLWIDDQAFRDFYISLLKNSGLEAYVWETPAITSRHLGRTFEFVLLLNPGWSKSPDHGTYAAYFDKNGGDHGIVVFESLPADAALLVVPSPQTDKDDYSNLPAFHKNAPAAAQHALWRTTATTIKRTLTENPMWISVAGGGIAWLHVRLDGAPKYYRHREYRPAPLD